jgi:hypothetical protein
MILQNGWMFSVTSPAGLLEPPLWRVLRSVAKSTLRVGFRARFYNSRRENRSKRRGFPILIQFEWRYWLTNEHRAFHDPPPYIAMFTVPAPVFSLPRHPLWVRSRPRAANGVRPFRTRKPTSPASRFRSTKCQQQTCSKGGLAGDTKVTRLQSRT